ncbi:carbohydrate ABC transporter permease [Galbitalea sp. SE-J8]|uniref:carbohydrate ABC transporter permease n=1 Tax=Galbitalea sp. SE-J8 TaxID=3054952 RepID=UPI00259D09AA|nr:carbohydrate ABC transporter permease [Galbitalea sp. SE-J8]MDM4762003.1 carbohydrate ABC transporter permease [Galbitalea sp. SE-J8]
MLRTTLRGLTRTPYYVLTAGIAIIFLFPLVWAAYASVAPRGGSAQAEGFGIGNYVKLLNYDAGLGTYVLNSVIVSGLTVIMTTVVALLAGYAFARFAFIGKNVLFILVLGILMVPSASLLIPLYVLLGSVGLSNSLFGLALVLTMYQLPFSIFMMRISFEAVPAELEESALVDGTTSFGALWYILTPAVLPGIVTIALYAFLAAWNDFIAPLILINDSSLAPLPLAIANLRQQAMGAIDYGVTEAGVVVLALPCVVLFLVLQRFYIKGFMSGALKG